MHWMSEREVGEAEGDFDGSNEGAEDFDGILEGAADGECSEYFDGMLEGFVVGSSEGCDEIEGE